MSNVRSLNRVILVGRVGRNPEITHIPSIERDVAKFSMATTEGYMDKNNQWQDTTEWHNIVGWGRITQKIEKSINKGDLVLVEGKIKTRKWQGQDGQDRRSTEIYIDNLVILEKKDKSSVGNVDRDQNKNGADNINEDQKDSINPDTQSPPIRDINEFPYDENGSDPF